MTSHLPLTSPPTYSTVLKNIVFNQEQLLKMLGTFPKEFSQAETSQGCFLKWQLPKCAISQVVTSQVCPSRSARAQLQP